MIWGHEGPGLQGAVVWTERVPGRGEDAEPFVAHHFGTAQGLVAVFDGSGGSGSSPVWQAPDGETRTGAWVGSRVARLATDCWFHDVVAEDQDNAPGQLRDYLEYFLSSAPQRRSKIVGRMRRQLPTTLAAVRYELRGESAECQALWAGDSRAYTLRPDRGLCVLTRDHTEEHDALKLLRSDPPMTNSVCADREFEIDSQRMAFPLPCVLLAATDGFFGYVQTPGDFEWLLLDTLMRARTPVEWADLLRREVQGYTADDASLALVALGYRDLSQIRAAFADRHDTMTKHYARTRPPAAATAAETRGWQDAAWQAYRTDYETYLPPLPEERI
ncbi:serine/threonine protein phosphatase [Streptomyces sp. XD-27]|uniref:serine/threonine protein phosphatase n=1 Tax=Streptomyces sp. XD-27 TaxID=3062779 RepID=UPI0026F41B75|nr:serine/threonine protein phosphatase [Streptomyces sp. XD-27]WKX73097.1 serine/threonine protein phosphatase [Streptomyces sp. XD-27]